MVKKKGEKFCKVCKKAVKPHSKKSEKPATKVTKKNICEFC